MADDLNEIGISLNTKLPPLVSWQLLLFPTANKISIAGNRFADYLPPTPPNPSQPSANTVSRDEN